MIEAFGHKERGLREPIPGEDRVGVVDEVVHKADIAGRALVQVPAEYPPHRPTAAAIVAERAKRAQETQADNPHALSNFTSETRHPLNDDEFHELLRSEDSLLVLFALSLTHSDLRDEEENPRIFTTTQEMMGAISSIHGITDTTQLRTIIPRLLREGRISWDKKSGNSMYLKEGERGEEWLDAMIGKHWPNKTPAATVAQS